MKVIDKFTIKSYLGPMVVSFFIVMFVLMMNFIWRYIDELVGKGLSVGVVAELMMYAAINLIPMGLPLATLFGAIMTMGNLGENYELLAMKSSGMSLLRILKPLIIMMVFVAVGSFFVANNLVPYANKEMSALIWDIRNQKQQIEFKDGLFFNGIENLSIRVEKQHPDSKLLTDVLIYDTRDRQKMSTTVADSGYISLSDDKKYLQVTLYNGEMFQENRGYRWFEESALTRNFFSEQNGIIPLDGFDFSRSDANLFGNASASQNIVQLEHGIDSLTAVVAKYNNQSFGPFLESVFTKDSYYTVDSLRTSSESLSKPMINVADSIQNLNMKDKSAVWQAAFNYATSSKHTFSYDEQLSKGALNDLYRYKVEWHKKISLPISILIFFLIGAALGAIIRKGGLGMPIIVSVGFFVVYYIISLTGEKMAKEGTWSSFAGMWLSTFILLPIAAFLSYKANNDSNLFNAEWYFVRLKRLKGWFVRIFGKNKKLNIKA